MQNALVVSFGVEGRSYVDYIQQRGYAVQVLDCFEPYHNQLAKWYPNELLHAHGHKSDVEAAVRRSNVDIAIVLEMEDFVRMALIVQTLKLSGLKMIIVVTADGQRKQIYRRIGCHRVLVASSVEEAQTSLNQYFPAMATA